VEIVRHDDVTDEEVLAVYVARLSELTLVAPPGARTFP